MPNVTRDEASAPQHHAPDTQEAVARRDLVAERPANLGGGERLARARTTDRNTWPTLSFVTA